ncbi:DUF1501 domain-containing protein [Pontibacter sp. G13]|uniref:DUF1501 domain-containing protein n=1 Tax=Pontibacter sp. G13 TaxID=3074898 RepID=UPI00288B184A|nr:DUF1501 domain-containing protein [Pontibacter sp. G13]WNJ21030.1 DUF1501 domain-containing protein [Pontibacter sp. G13]
MHSRRDFLKWSSLASASVMMPSFLHALGKGGVAPSGKRLVVIQLSGGNDGLNTFVPFRNDDYYRARPGLAIAPNNVIKLTQEQGINPALAPLQKWYDKGWVQMINGVGYPNPDRSHFRSMDIWHTGSNSDEYWETGWLGRYLDHACEGAPEPHRMIETEETLSLAVKGANIQGLGMRDIKQLQNSSRNQWVRHLAGRESSGNAELDFMHKVMTETMSSADYLQEQVGKERLVRDFPQNPLARQLKLVAELMVAGVNTSVFYTSLTGFDTHVRQANQHSQLLKNYAEAVDAFIEVMRKYDLFKDTLVLTFSEFGRRVAQNASQGTDHGKANNLWIVGGNLKKAGIVNDSPDLVKLDDGDVSLSTDFRSVYATILDNWLEVDSQQILKRSFGHIDLV